MKHFWEEKERPESGDILCHRWLYEIIVFSGAKPGRKKNRAEAQFFPFVSKRRDSLLQENIVDNKSWP